MYCSNCGRELRDGEICNCTQNNIPAENQLSQEVKNENNNEKKQVYDLNRLFLAFVSVFTLTLELIKRPCSTVQDFMNRDNGKMGVKLMLVKAGIMCLYVIILTSAGGFRSNVVKTGIIVAAFMVTFALDFIYSFVISLCAKTIAKTELDTVTTMEIAGLKAAGEMAGIILAAVCAVFFSLSFVFVAIGIIFGMVLSYTAVLQLAQINKDKRVHIFIASVVVMSIIAALVLTVVSGGMLINNFNDMISMY